MENNKCVVWIEGKDTEYKKLLLTNDQIRLIKWLENQEYPIEIIANYSDDTEWEEI